MKIEVSNGEIIDKITILKIKLEKIKNPDKLVNIQKENDLLHDYMQMIKVDENHPLFQKLYEINLKLWEVEDLLRIKETRKEFDQEFIELARSVYFINDNRAAVKRDINQVSGSDLFEEKEYVNYK